MDARKLMILALGIFSAVILLLSTENISWLFDEIFAIIVSIIFISPVIDAFFDFRAPKEYIVVFIIGGILFAIYSYLYCESLAGFFELMFKTILLSIISVFGVRFVKILEKWIPP